VDSSSPKGPHSQVQNEAATTMATGESPALRPHTSGSTIWPVNGSTTANSATVHIAMVQSLPTAAASAMGSAAASTAPMYGTNRRIIANRPQSGALGTPMTARPSPITTPKIAFRTSCVANRRPSLRPASSIAAVVRSRSPLPARRMKRSRRSSR
jgi:hypothetical protein